MSVVIETTIGDITVDLYTKDRPNTCLNFLKLCKMKYYNLCVFYKIEKNFIAQTGDPSATGRGGESVFCHLYGEQAKYFDGEFKPRLKHEKLGTLSMVNNGNNMNGSQFFLTLSENLTYLDENHSVFGEVTEGFDILLKLNDAICDNNSRPYQDIRITHTVILHDPFEDPKGLEIPDASPEPTREMLESNYIGADEEIDDTKGKTAEEVEEKIKESEAKARATILEMVGDIPDADVKPPENVLFVCKLNPVTTSDDLEIIFSRFGKILSCEVIKDRKTGESLQYAFIEFEKEEDCEAAYFKMDNVLIDDRRIHVDFSQSVSKLYFNRNKPQSAKTSFSLKGKDKNDGYDLIFDSEDEPVSNDKNSKSKSSSEYKSSNRNSSYDSSHKDDRNINREKKDGYKNSDKNLKNYRHGSEREKYRTQEYDHLQSSYKNQSEKGGHLRYNDKRYPSYSDTNREARYDKGSKYRDEYYPSSRTNKESDHRSRATYSSNSASKSYRESEHYRKVSSDSYSQKHKASVKRKCSSSPEPPKKSYERGRSSYSTHKKHSDSSDSEKCEVNYKKSKDIVKEKVKSSSYKPIKDGSKKSNVSKKLKSKKSRSSSVSSSTSSSSTSSASSSSSSSTHDKNRAKDNHQKRKKLLDSHKKTTSHKKKKHNC